MPHGLAIKIAASVLASTNAAHVSAHPPFVQLINYTGTSFLRRLRLFSPCPGEIKADKVLVLPYVVFVLNRLLLDVDVLVL